MLRRDSSVASFTRWASPPDKRRGGLAHLDIAQADVADRLQLVVNARDVREEIGRFVHAHLEHVGDGLALVLHFERLLIVALALAGLARHVDVGQEMHLDLDDAVAVRTSRSGRL